jgi:hypothetical protein
MLVIVKPGIELLRAAMRKKDLRTRGVAALVNHDHSLVVRWLAGTRTPSLEDALILQEKLDIPLVAWRKRRSPQPRTSAE